MSKASVYWKSAWAALVAVLCILALAICIAPRDAYADGDDADILLGMYPIGAAGGTNNVYGSYDGGTFYRLASVYESAEGQSYMDNHYAQSCTSIIYHDGYFWALSGWGQAEDLFWPLISYSKDLVHWTHPEADKLLASGSTHGIPLETMPYIGPDKSIEAGKFEVVAPEWSITANGDIYIVFTAGYYGEWHGEATVDQMQAYTVRVSTLSAKDGTPDGDSGYLWPNQLKFVVDGAAKKLEFSNYENANYIDGQLFSDGGTDYLIIKRDGLKNQLYKTNNIADPKAWTHVNEEVTFGYEGPCMVKFNDKYRLYTDGVTGTRPNGVRVAVSDSLEKAGSWGEPNPPMFIDENDQQLVARHGSVITLKAGTPEWQVAKNLLDNQKRTVSGFMCRVYNPNSGEHFYTADGTESGYLASVGWNYEGKGWLAPSKNDKPVYRLYSGTDHHYTMSEEEKDWLVSVGWSYEGVGWYSAGEDGAPLYRQFNPNVDPTASFNNSGSHNYTTSKEENDSLVAVGWNAEGIGWYGLGS